MTDQCMVCDQRITMSDWAPFCCEICFDSDDAETRRDLERMPWYARPKQGVADELGLRAPREAGVS